MSLQGKVALVTGATRGIGQAIALELGRLGATVIGTATSEAGAQRIAESLKANGIEGTGLVLNVSDNASVAAALEQVQTQFGAPSILVNNAGITRDNLMLRMKDDEWFDVIGEGIDVTVRIGSPEAWSPLLGHRFLGQDQKVFCAAPGYLDAHGVPASLDDLDRHAAIMYGKADGTVSAWLVRHGSALVERRGASERIVAGDAEAQAGLVLAGLGVAQMSTWLVGRHLREGSLVRILPRHAVAGLPIHVVWPKAKEDVPRVRELVGTLCAALEWDGLNAGWNAPPLSRRTGDIDA